MAIKNPDIAAKTRITLILLEKSLTLAKGEVIGRASTGEQCYPLLEDRRALNIEQGYSFYRIDTEADVNLAIGLIDEKMAKYQHMFAYCHSSEGIVFNAMSESVKYWAAYYYLGYDSEVTCDNESVHSIKKIPKT